MGSSGKTNIANAVVCEHAYPLSTKIIERNSQLAKLQMYSEKVGKLNQNIDAITPP